MPSWYAKEVWKVDPKTYSWSYVLRVRARFEVLDVLPERVRIGVGVCNQKVPHIEAVEQIVAKGENAIRLFGKERVLLSPDCGFATFADNPVTSERVAEEKLKALAQGAAILRERHGV